MDRDPEEAKEGDKTPYPLSSSLETPKEEGAKRLYVSKKGVKCRERGSRNRDSII